jgi:hypothetical protein
MAKTINYYKTYTKYFAEEYNKLLDEYNTRISKARDGKQGAAHYKFYYELLEIYGNTQRKLGNVSQFLIDINKELDEDKDKELETEFNSKFSKLKVKNESELLKEIAELEAQNEFIKYVQLEELKFIAEKNNDTLKQTPLADLNSASISSSIKWKGENITGFTQLIYGLFHSGYLSNNENEITKLVEDVAKAFNIELSKNWQSNLSKSIHKSKNDYDPKIFKEIENAFKKYYDNQINKDK